MEKDLGTYHLRVEFEDGRGYIQKWNTGMRFTSGRNNNHPLAAQPIQPPLEDEAELIGAMRFIYSNGNYSCDCNKRIFLADAQQSEDEVDETCGETIITKRLTLIRPDGSESVIFELA